MAAPSVALARSSAPKAAAVPAGPAPVAAPPTRAGGAVLGMATPLLSLAARPAAGGGQTLPGPVRAAIERSTGARLGDVRVHQGGRAAAALDAAGARAVTYGNSIYLASRESPADLALMAHEATHVIQQRGAPRLQAKAGSGSVGVLEAEADRVAISAVRGERRQVVGSTAPRPQFEWSLAGLAKAVDKASGGLVGAVGDKLSQAGAAIAEGLDGLRLKALAFIKERAQSIPGYDLLGFAISRDPLTQTPIDRNATTLLKAVLGLVPGGAQIFQDLQQSKALERAFAWVSAELERVGLSWARVRAAVEAFIASLGIGDAVNLTGVFSRAKAMFGAIIDAAVNFAKASGRKLIELAFEGAMALAGSAGQRVLGVFQKIGDTFGLIAADPGAFFSNLGAAIMGGFEQFRDKFGLHLQNALVGWLFGALQGAGLKLPDKFDARGILSIVLQVLGLTYDKLRARLVDLVGEKVVATVETTLDFVVTLVKEGIAAAWEKIVAFAGNVKDMLIGAIKDFIGKTIIKEALKLVGKLLVPGGALVTLCIKIYETVMFVIEKAKALLDFVEAVVDSIANIARGNIGAARNYVEKTLAKLLPLVIGFMAQMVGLGGISGHIKKAIETIQAPINAALDKIVAWIKEKAQSLVGKVTDWWKARRGFKTKSGEDHELYYSGTEKNAVAMVASKEPKTVRKKIEEFDKQASSPSASPEEKKGKAKLQQTAQLAEKQPNAPTLLEDMKEFFNIYQSAGRQVKVDRKTGTLAGDTVGTEMTIDWLGAKHPEGTTPESGVHDKLMGLLVTNPKTPSESKYIRGHLLNHNLGGRGNAENMFPITGNANSQHSSSIEKKVKGWVDKEGKEKPAKWVWYQVKVAGISYKLDSGPKSRGNYVDCVFACHAKLIDTAGATLDTTTSSITSKFGEKMKAETGDQATVANEV